MSVPSRVIERTIKKLSYGFMPHDGRGQAKTAAGSIVSYQHPDAVQFTATGAVVRAIFELTGKPAKDYDTLWDRTMVPLKNEFGERSWTKLYDFLHAMDKDTCIEFYSTYLRKLRSYD